MGFLDHSTNNILVDAVLTTEGRESLADGSFDISYFSLGDDEVDYTIIQKFGKQVGKEKIEKNTPIFESLTNSSCALRYPLLSLSPTTTGGIFLYPLGNFSGSDLDNNGILQLTVSNASAKTFKFAITMDSDNLIPPELRGGDFIVEVDGNLLLVDNGAGSIAENSYPDGTLVYNIAPNTSNTAREQSCEVQLVNSTNISSQLTFNLYKSGTDQYVRTYVNIMHRASGVRKTLEVNIYYTQQT